MPGPRTAQLAGWYAAAAFHLQTSRVQLENDETGPLATPQHARMRTTRICFYLQVTKDCLRPAVVANRGSRGCVAVQWFQTRMQDGSGYNKSIDGFDILIITTISGGSDYKCALVQLQV